MEEQGAHAGTVTRLAVQKKNPDRASVFVDGAYSFGVHQDLVLEFGLHAGRVLTDEDIVRIRRADARLAARSLALRYVAQRARTEHEVRRKLADAGRGYAEIQALRIVHFARADSC